MQSSTTQNVTSKKVFIQTWGCQMNEADTEIIKSILAKENFAFVPKEDDADIIMLNTCAIRENAHRKVYGRVHDIHHRREGRPVMIGILGCMATNLRKELFENRKLKIDFIAGPDSYKRLPDLIREASTTGEKQFDATLSEFETYSDIYPVHTKGVNAWLAVSRGCNNFCTFCVVPYTRGRERSRAPENIVQEVRRLAEDGFKQVTFLGQNVNSYFYEGTPACPAGRDFASLLEEVSQVNGIERIRFTSPHPKDFPRRLLQVIAQNPKVCKHVHLPLQAGNNRVLDVMNRTYTQEEYLSLVEEIRTLIPNVALTTDIIVGFPTETPQEFEDTVKVMRQVEFDSAFIFKYSERKGTVASKQYPDDISEEEKTRRIMELNELQKAVTFKKNQAHTGEVHAVLIEEKEMKPAGYEFRGRTDGHKLVIFNTGEYDRGDTVRVKITSATPHALKGEVAVTVTKPVS